MYVSVAFNENGKTYDYNVPTYLEDKVINLRPNYVIVEDVYCTYIRYKVAKVLEIRRGESYKATKDIVDVVDSTNYVQKKALEKAKDNVINDIMEILEELDLKYLAGIKELFETCKEKPLYE